MIRRIEELSINAFPTSESLYYDGWILRISKGKSKRLNSVYSLYPSTKTLEEKIKVCEEIYSSKNLKRVFKLTDQSPLELDEVLRERGYEESGRTSIQTIDLSRYSYESQFEVEVLNEFSQEWFDDYCRVGNKTEDDIKAFKNAWSNLIPEHCYLSYKINDKRIAFAMGVMEDGYGGVFGILVKKDLRGNGYGNLITSELLNVFKKRGYLNSYLQVEVSNTNANNLYSKLGYKEIYQYWYLLKEVNE